MFRLLELRHEVAGPEITHVLEVRGEIMEHLEVGLPVGSQLYQFPFSMVYPFFGVADAFFRNYYPIWRKYSFPEVTWPKLAS